jgi:hypothetical protein
LVSSIISFLLCPSRCDRLLGEYANRHKNHYRFEFFSEVESDKVYERYHIPAPGGFIWGTVLANFEPGHQEGYVNFNNYDRAPLLLIAGGEDIISACGGVTLSRSL